MPQSRMNKRSSSARSPRLPVVAHKSTGGMLNSIPQPVDPVGNASERLTNNTVALPIGRGRVSEQKVMDRKDSARKGHNAPSNTEA